MKTFFIHGLSVLVDSEFSSVISRLELDLGFFLQSQKKTDLEIAIFRERRLRPGRKPTFSGRGYVAYGWGLPRTVFYNDGACLRLDKYKDKMRAKIYCNNENRAYELSFLVLQSIVGEILEARGWTRLHALSFDHGGSTAAVLLPSGGGKSTLSYLMTQTKGWRVFSDELTFLKDDQFHPFPWRMTLDEKSLSFVGEDRQRYPLFQRTGGKPKYLLPFQNESVAGSSKRGPIFWGILSNRNHIRKPSIIEKISFAVSVFRGEGLTQMVELALRLDNINLPRIAVRRMVWIIKTWKHLRVLELNRNFPQTLTVLSQVKTDYQMRKDV